MTDKETGAPAPEVKTVHVAKLDSDGGFIGVEIVPEALASGRVAVPPEVDLPADGSYRWVDGQFRHWKELHAPSRPPSTLEYVIFDLVRHLADNGNDLPPRVREWAAWYATSPQRKLVEARHPSITEQ